MSLIPPTHDALPYIDAEPTPSQRAAASALITSELPSLDISTPTTHPLLPSPPAENYTPLILSEFERIAASRPLTGIDTSRYESLDPPSTKDKTEWQNLLTKAYTSYTYLSSRQNALGKLEESGKEDWLAGNAELTAILQRLEKELAGTKEQIDLLAVERRNTQEGVKGEMDALERTWREGVGRVLETEVAAEGLRAEVLNKRRGGGI